MNLHLWVTAAFFGTACASGPPRVAAEPSEGALGRGVGAPGSLPPGNDTLRLVAGLDSKRDVGACELARILDGGAGVFRVGRMTSRVEPGTQPGASGVFTYVELDLLEPWGEGTSERVVARVHGGELPSGETSTSSVAISRGEVLGILLYGPRPENLGYPQMDSLGVFRPNGMGGYTNGQLFVEVRLSLSEIGALLSANADGVCRREVLPSPRRPPQAPVEVGPIRPPLEEAVIHPEGGVR